MNETTIELALPAHQLRLITASLLSCAEDLAQLRGRGINTAIDPAELLRVRELVWDALVSR